MRRMMVLILAAFVECAVAPSARCPPLLFPNGRVRMRSRGKIIRFTCNEGYTLVGNKYSTCIRGRWDTPTPVCVNSQCPPPPQPKHSLVATTYNGAVSMYFCEPGYTLVGAAEIYCNGRKWNATAPYCRDSGAAAPTSCDFEKEDLCWWEQDPVHDFDWQRHNHDTPSSHIGTGPSHDHTLGPGYDGYYLYIEASGRLVNDTARIISPLYNASLSDSGCFSFWYHMYGATIGALKIYFKPEKSPSQLMFEKSGNQGNRWLRGFFPLPTNNTSSFQIIIEGIRGSSYISDIAVDDVAILQGDECAASAETTNSPDVVSTIDDQNMYDLQSCRGRCSERLNSTLPPDACLCDLDCVDISMCCPDFAEYCVLGVTDLPTKSVGTESDGQVPPTKAPPAASIPAKKPIPISTKDDIDPLTKNTEISLTTLGERRTTSKSTTTTTTTTTKTPRRPTTTTTTTTKIPTKRVTRTTARPITRKPTTIQRETPFATKVTEFWQDPALVSARTEAHVRVEQATIQGSSMSSLGISGIAAIAIVALSTIVLTTVVTYVIVRKRKSYKRGAGGSGSALSEDSDVRYLTSDEILDFNLARPSEYDQM